MSQFNAINIDVIKRIAHALGELNQRVVYVGGSVVSLYVNDPGADDVRPTQDIDLSLEITSLGELENLRQELAEKRFMQSPEDPVICRFRYQGIPVDIMATEEIGWAPANRWFKPGFKHLKLLELESELEIRILSLPYFLATKFDAYSSRGDNDPRTSKDFEDIIYVMDNNTNISQEILDAPNDVKEFLQVQIKSLLTNEMEEAVLSHLDPYTQSERYELLIKKLKKAIR
ncbi:hypothetical protein L21SP5_03848 [Salinivirga cyanobacteriivorans]|uniref:Nucleotidyl transferase AbiEii toxin, Type IV TA system n=1 Tax=Salinivirga cyanobacteriivorans TaxID=1307839 RepID=A0A0S2I527_9BACT|nr:nucleotidyl transferase AbiEii/AbiGii toxin family protein [Salinivirga cyanobacteriivorans]ALO17441.1 hypothetical protein L21SP5_03848 [Salinivirga cyanobacteriivorans]